MQILLTAFDSYDEWSENSSWLALVEFLREGLPHHDLVTRRYPVNLTELRKQLAKDLEKPYDAVLHLGQAPGISAIKLESVALNVAGRMEEKGDELSTIVEAGPLAFQSRLPLGQWADALRQANIPTLVSYHAGTFLCNATMYLTHFWYHTRQLNVPVGFIHLPLATEQVAKMGISMPSLPSATLAAALSVVLGQLADELDGEQSVA